MKTDIIKLPDGGYCLSVVVSQSGRELELVWPSDWRPYHKVYFVARTDGERQAGLLRGPPGFASLLQWVNGWEDLSAEGLEIAALERVVTAELLNLAREEIAGTK